MADINKIIDSLSDEELDLLNSDPQMLEEFKAKHGAGGQSFIDVDRRLPPIVGGVLGAERYTGIGPENIAEEVGRYAPQVAGAIGGGVIGGPIGAVAGAAGGEAIRGLAQDIASRYGYAPSRTMQEAITEPVYAAAGEAAGGAIGGIAGALARTQAARSIGSGLRKVGAQGIRVMTGVPEREAAAVLRDPDILSRAMPLEQAGQVYERATGGAAAGTTEARRALTGKTYLSPESAINSIDEIMPAIDAASDTEVLALRQSLMDTIADTPMKQPRLRKLLADRIEALDTELEKRLPDWTGARKAWREAKVKEEFSSWLPLNKNLSPNVLRTTAAAAAAIKGLSEGSAWGLPFLAGVSPRLWGYGIRGAAGAAKAVPGVYRGVSGPIAKEQIKGIFGGEPEIKKYYK